MNAKTKTAVTFFKAMTCAVALLGMAALAQAQDAKVDPTGTWTWVNAGRNGGPGRTNTLTLKYASGALSGTLKAPGRGGAATPMEIADGKLDGNKISFKVTREMGDNTLTITYDGTVTADTIKGKITTTGGSQTRPARDWEAKREAASK
jgi:hypothetical protein